MTLFEKIVAREIPARIIYEDADVLAFHDVNPQAPVHALVVPKRCIIARIGEATSADEALLGRLLLAAGHVAGMLNLTGSGYRVVINHGPDGGETVPHLHLHVLGGRAMDWPPG